MPNAPPVQRANAFMMRSKIRADEGEIEASSRDCTSVINLASSLDWQRVGALGLRAWNAYKKGDYHQMEVDSLAALEIDSSQAWIRANLGLAILRQGRIPEATSVYQEVLSELQNPHQIDQLVVDDLKEALVKEPDLSGAKDILQLAESRRDEFQQLMPGIA